MFDRINKIKYFESGYNFNVEIVHCEVNGVGNMWYVYCNIFRKHRLFNIIKEYTNDDINNIIGEYFHRGYTFNEFTYDEKGNILYITIGSYYAHYGDNYFKCKTIFPEIKKDAIRLYKYLEGKNEEL